MIRIRRETHAAAWGKRMREGAKQLRATGRATALGERNSSSRTLHDDCTAHLRTLCMLATVVTRHGPCKCIVASSRKAATALGLLGLALLVALQAPERARAQISVCIPVGGGALGSSVNGCGGYGGGVRSGFLPSTGGFGQNANRAGLVDSGLALVGSPQGRRSDQVLDEVRATSARELWPR